MAQSFADFLNTLFSKLNQQPAPNATPAPTPAPTTAQPPAPPVPYPNNYGAWAKPGLTGGLNNPAFWNRPLNPSPIPFGNPAPGSAMSGVPAGGWAFTGGPAPHQPTPYVYTPPTPPVSNVGNGGGAGDWNSGSVGTNWPFGGDPGAANSADNSGIGGQGNASANGPSGPAGDPGATGAMAKGGPVRGYLFGGGVRPMGQRPGFNATAPMQQFGQRFSPMLQQFGQRFGAGQGGTPPWVPQLRSGLQALMSRGFSGNPQQVLQGLRPMMQNRPQQSTAPQSFFAPQASGVPVSGIPDASPPGQAAGNSATASGINSVAEAIHSGLGIGGLGMGIAANAPGITGIGMALNAMGLNELNVPDMQVNNELSTNNPAQDIGAIQDAMANFSVGQAAIDAANTAVADGTSGGSGSASSGVGTGADGSGGNMGDPGGVGGGGTYRRGGRVKRYEEGGAVGYREGRVRQAQQSLDDILAQVNDAIPWRLNKRFKDYGMPTQGPGVTADIYKALGIGVPNRHEVAGMQRDLNWSMNMLANARLSAMPRDTPEQRRAFDQEKERLDKSYMADYAAQLVPGSQKTPGVRWRNRHTPETGGPYGYDYGNERDTRGYAKGGGVDKSTALMRILKGGK